MMTLCLPSGSPGGLRKVRINTGSSVSNTASEIKTRAAAVKRSGVQTEIQTAKKAARESLS